MSMYQAAGKWGEEAVDGQNKDFRFRIVRERPGYDAHKRALVRHSSTDRATDRSTVTCCACEDSR